MSKTQNAAMIASIVVCKRSKSSPNHLISAAEALGVAFAISAFGSTFLESDSMVAVLGSVRWYSPSKNLAFALKQVVLASIAHEIRPSIVHVSGKKNALADGLSRMHEDSEVASLLAWLDPSMRISASMIVSALPDLHAFLFDVNDAGRE